ncbi:MAG: hypothetical protein ACE5GD_02085 [Candidatus Geothermarchaeales archaeon]
MVSINTNPLIAAAIATAGALCLVYIFSRWLKAISWRFWGLVALGVLTIVPLPLVRPPVFDVLTTIFDYIHRGTAWSLTAIVAWNFVNGFIQEASKLSPLLIPQVRDNVKEAYSKLITGFCLGVGFAIGEIWYLGWPLTSEYAGHAWYEYGNFIIEMLFIVPIHGAMAMIAIWGMPSLKVALTLILASWTHAMANIPTGLMHAGYVNQSLVETASSITFIALFVFMVLWFYRTRPAGLDHGRAMHRHRH